LWPVLFIVYVTGELWWSLWLVNRPDWLTLMQILLIYEFPIAENLCKICYVKISYVLFVYQCSHVRMAGTQELMGAHKWCSM
jgi:hypothetical protein